MTVPSGPPVDDVLLHALSNHLAVILGFVELVLADTPADDPRHADLVEVRRAAVAAAGLIGRPLRDAPEA